MKVFCLFIVFFILSVQPYAARGKTCQSASHCRPDECCMTKSSMMGGCRAMGCQGCPCLMNNSKSHLGDMYLMSCPCIEGLVCVPEKTVENPEDQSTEYINSTCQTVQPGEVGQRGQPLPEYERLPRFLQKVIKSGI